ncbi:MAG: hypothetical protein AB1Z98_38635 [Nannocystaceae bacterium]
MMKNYRRVFLGLGACSLLAALSGCDQGEIEYDDGDFTVELRAADGDPPCGRAQDHNFECAVDDGALTPWQALGMDVPEDVRSKFRLWTTMVSPDVPSMVTADCSLPPPGGNFSPVKAAGKGGVTRGDIVVAKEAVTVYRAYTENKFMCGSDSPAGSIGSWWSLTRPAGDKQAYRESLGICAAWNDLSMIYTCTLAAGTVAVVGPTQSVDCEGTSTCDPAPAGWEDPLPATTAPALFINSYGRSQQDLDEFLLDCKSEPWSG